MSHYERQSGTRESGSGEMVAAEEREYPFFLFCAFCHPSVSVLPLHSDSAINIYHCIALNLQIKWICQHRPKAPHKYRCALHISITDFEEGTGIVQRRAFESKFYIQIMETLDGFLNIAFTAWGVNGREQWLDNSLFPFCQCHHTGTKRFPVKLMKTKAFYYMR